jgi:hypothetical protein
MCTLKWYKMNVWQVNINSYRIRFSSFVTVECLWRNNPFSPNISWRSDVSVVKKRPFLRQRPRKFCHKPTGIKYDQLRYRARYHNFSASKPNLSRLFPICHTFLCPQFPSSTMIQQCSSTNQQKRKNQWKSNKSRGVSQRSACCALFETVESQSSQIYKKKMDSSNALASVYIYRYGQGYWKLRVLMLYI